MIRTAFFAFFFMGIYAFSFPADLKKETSTLLKKQTDPLIFSDYFSPNGDLKNDTFMIKNLENYGNCELLVFNRWGDKVYEANPYMNDWNGKANSGYEFFDKNLPEGVYFYVFIDGTGTKYNGKVTLKR